MSLGWLGTSGKAAKRKERIDGVSAGSIVGLKSVLFEAQSSTVGRARAARPIRSKSNVRSDIKGNVGVHARAARDEEAIEASTFSEARRQERLREKTKLYERLSEYGAVDDEDGGAWPADSEPVIDFERKYDGYFEDEKRYLHGEAPRGPFLPTASKSDAHSQKYTDTAAEEEHKLPWDITDNDPVDGSGIPGAPFQPPLPDHDVAGRDVPPPKKKQRRTRGSKKESILASVRALRDDT